ncbi:MAG: Calx-beta domain-containing protein [Acidobacteriota bacterium]
MRSSTPNGHMKKWRASALAPVLTGALVLAGPAVAQERVLIVGDSWAQGLWEFGTLGQTFAANGRSDIEELGDETAIGGTTAADWNTAAGRGLLADELRRTPSIDTVHLTVGGNDLLAGRSGGGWFVGMPSNAESALLARIAGDIMAVADLATGHSPSVEVVVSLYDYPNFEDFSGECAEAWRELGSPTPRQMNEGINRFHDAVAAAAAPRPRVSVVDHRGLMQFTAGIPDDGVAPGALRPPGDLDRPSPRQAMDDCIHLTREGLRAVGQNLWTTFYDRRFNGGGGGGGGAPRIYAAADRIDAAEDAAEVAVRVDISEAPRDAVQVDYTTAGATAAAGEDFLATAGTLTWPAGDGEPRTVRIRLLDDGTPEVAETFALRLGGAVGGVLDSARSTTEVTILDDDGMETCAPGDSVMCLQGGRFRVDVEWKTPDGAAGRGTTQPLTDASGLFWVFGSDNIEMLLKILDGCQIPGLEAYWVFFAATTNVEYTVRVTDTRTGRTKEYRNPQGMPAQPVQDLGTFTACP